MVDLTPYKDFDSDGIESVYLQVPFDRGKQVLESQDYNIVSVKDLAKMIMSNPSDEKIRKRACWTREAIVYLPDKMLFTKNSPIMEAAAEATACHNENKLFCVDDEKIARARAGGIWVPYGQSTVNVSTRNFADSEITRWMFEETAEDFGRFLAERGVSQFCIYVDTPKNMTFARQMWHLPKETLKFGIDCEIKSLSGERFAPSYMRGIRPKKEGDYASNKPESEAVMQPQVPQTGGWGMKPRPKTEVSGWGEKPSQKQQDTPRQESSNTLVSERAAPISAASVDKPKAESYNVQQISQALTDIGITGDLEKRIIDRLREI